MIRSFAAVRMHSPPHPGDIIRSLCLEPLGVSRKTLSAIVNGRAPITPEMAVRLSIAFSTSAESWLNQQAQFDLWRANRSRKRLKVRRLAA